MRNYYNITISDLSGSRYYNLKKSSKTYLIIASVVIFGIVTASVSLNYFQHYQNRQIRFDEASSNYELEKYIRSNTSLRNTIAAQNKMAENISHHLVEIERHSGVETGDRVLSLEDRIWAIKEFYIGREETYSEISNRVEEIEDLIGLDTESLGTPQNAQLGQNGQLGQGTPQLGQSAPLGDNAAVETVEDAATEQDLIHRVELASLSLSQQKILHDSVPNGYPTHSEVVTSGFGPRIHPVTRIKSFHKGTDLRAKTGDQVYATADGVVSAAGFTQHGGNRIIVVHNFGFETRYAHLEKMEVSPGDVVHKGDMLGFSGNTGLSAAPHLHYEVRYLGKAINAIQFIEWEFGSYEIFSQVRGVKWPSLISLINKQITHQTLQLSQAAPSSSGNSK